MMSRIAGVLPASYKLLPQTSNLYAVRDTATRQRIVLLDENGNQSDGRCLVEFGQQTFSKNECFKALQSSHRKPLDSPFKILTAPRESRKLSIVMLAPGLFVAFNYHVIIRFETTVAKWMLEYLAIKPGVYSKPLLGAHEVVTGDLARGCEGFFSASVVSRASIPNVQDGKASVFFPVSDIESGPLEAIDNLWTHKDWDGIPELYVSFQQHYLRLCERQSEWVWVLDHCFDEDIDLNQLEDGMELEECPLREARLSLDFDTFSVRASPR